MANQVTDAGFKKEVLESAGLVVVDFWAPWCGPCKMLAPVVDALAEEYAGKAKFLKLNVDDNPQVPSNYGIMSIPTLIFFKGGKVMEQSVGVLSRQDLAKKIEANL